MDEQFSIGRQLSDDEYARYVEEFRKDYLYGAPINECMNDEESAILEKLEENIREHEKKIECEIKKARENGDIYIECADWGLWKIHDIDGYYAAITSKDWAIIQEHLNDSHDNNNEIFCESMLSFMENTICKGCRQHCSDCRIHDLKRIIYRRLPAYDSY